MITKIRPRSLFACVAVLFASVAAFDAKPASANGFGLQPTGFFHSFGFGVRRSFRTPPYFATNPPVYYGARHARPYGISPFPAPPLPITGPGYHSRLDSRFVTPPAAVSSPSPSSIPNHEIHSPSDLDTVNKGPVRYNPFVEGSQRIAKN